MVDLKASAELDILTNWHFFRSLFFLKIGKPTQAGVPARQHCTDWQTDVGI